MKDQHKYIKGYRDLSSQEISLMNEIKEQATAIEQLITKLEKDACVDTSWLMTGMIDLQKGFMLYYPCRGQTGDFLIK